MNHVVWVGAPYFAPALERMGWRLTSIPGGAGPFTWQDLVRRAGAMPDMVVLGDESRPPVLLNPECFPCPTLFYCVDTHIHSWYPIYAQSFDLVAVAMRDHIPRFLSGTLTADQVLWLPLFARYDDRLQHHIPGDLDVVFVGKNDPLLTPGRHRLLGELSRLVPRLAVLKGDYRPIYARAKLVLNIAEHGDLNFRVFEALGCGKCLLTPKVGHGFDELFHHGVDCFAYDQGCVDGLAATILELLTDPARRESVARTGHETVNAGHRTSHRAAALSGWISGMDLQKLVRNRLSTLPLIREVTRPLYLHWAESSPEPLLRERYLSAALDRS
jgi:glycosyltransferase involved in cell wall biosynthesis